MILSFLTKVTLVILFACAASPKDVKRLRSSLPPTSSIHLLEILFNNLDHNLPPDIENTDSIPYHHIPILLKATLSFKPHFKKLISDFVYDQQQHEPKPLFIITSMFFEWCAEIVKELVVFHALFTTGGGFGFACYYSLWLIWIILIENRIWLNLPHRNTDFDEFLLPDFPEASKIHVTQMTELLKVADGKNWLDLQPRNSVLYLSFESQNTISASQMMELALALEASGKNFIWVVRPPIGFDINSEFKANEWLPEGFEERMKNSRQGLVIHKWAPQVDILSHNSVSAFLSHCGWNSVLESLSQGVPIIGWLKASEQFYNAKLLEEEIGVCVEVARGKSCVVKHQEIVAKIELVMNETGKGNE
ncbi:hypothetical protein EZV62_001775 [Acer yangbiense]|uniref:UDP-glycosyltransferases domain-containing protein n=1 Tax=Acer yangbiense TaxID=1000413 RepID=A0A5C7IXM6_9ROSI|nr:hypothetical protein EZV62_001775 [Acer yangbiense]